MTESQRRIEILRMTKPEGVSVPDMGLWLAMATKLDAWVVSGAGQSRDETRPTPDPTPTPKVRTQRP